ncbi:MAG: L-histidine N(alpha)-methyltransferase [Bacteroidales bacterium]|nr:L-histidine N(alpha)-methyltransferase [Bacteroidales bacterium]
MQKTLELTDMALEVVEGLKASKKYISSKFFYDAGGSRIFQDIMQMPEYYPTGCEAEIFETHKRRIGSLFCRDCNTVELVELGAGNGQKTRILIRGLLDEQVNFRYIPVDISEEAVIQLEGSMKQQFPGLSMVTRIGDYFHMIEDLSREYPDRKVVMFLGSNLGNFNREQSISFLSQLNLVMSDDDLFFIGLDLKKDPEVIRRAYDDPHGHTRDFNLNLLKRLNRELGADFNLDHFMHAPYYDPETGTAKSYLVSTRDQNVRLQDVDDTIHFGKWETIYTEMSQKYDMEMIHDLADASGFRVAESFFDRREYFVNSLWEKV